MDSLSKAPVFFSPENIELSNLDQNDLFDKYLSRHVYRQFVDLYLGLSYLKFTVNHVTASTSFLAVCTNHGLRVFNYSEILASTKPCYSENYHENKNIVHAVFASPTKILIPLKNKIELIDLSAKKSLWKSPSLAESINCIRINNSLIAALVSKPVQFRERSSPVQAVVLLKLGSNAALSISVNHVKDLYFEPKSATNLVLFYENKIKIIDIKKHGETVNTFPLSSPFYRSIETPDSLHLICFKHFYEFSGSILYEAKMPFSYKISQFSALFNNLIIPSPRGIIIIPVASRFTRPKALNFNEVLTFCISNFRLKNREKVIRNSQLELHIHDAVEEELERLKSWWLLPDNIPIDYSTRIKEAMIDYVAEPYFGDIMNSVAQEKYIIMEENITSVVQFNNLIVYFGDNFVRVLK